MKPDVTTNKENELKLRKIATKGGTVFLSFRQHFVFIVFVTVIQLFSAVSKAQSTDEKLALQEEKRKVAINGGVKTLDDIKKEEFFDLLKVKGRPSTSENVLFFFPSFSASITVIYSFLTFI